jgi:hypothetical protein
MADINDLFAPPVRPGWSWQGNKPFHTPLSLPEEMKFRLWVMQNKVPFDDSPKADYDMRGFWKDIASQGSAQGTQMKSDGMHFPDTYKTPYHKSFSAESMYAPSDAPTWQGNDASGWKLVDKNGRVVVDESNLKILK